MEKPKVRMQMVSNDNHKTGKQPKIEVFKIHTFTVFKSVCPSLVLVTR